MQVQSNDLAGDSGGLLERSSDVAGHLRVRAHLSRHSVITGPPIA
jgi:hypothetical protein